MTLRRGFPSASRRPLKQSLCRPWATEARNGRRGIRQERAPDVAPCEEACRVASTSCGADRAPGRAAVKWENAQCSKVGVAEGVCRRPLGRSRRWRASRSAERSRRGQYLFLYLHDLAWQLCCPVYAVYVSFYPSLFSPFFFLCHFSSPASRTWRLGWHGVMSECLGSRLGWPYLCVRSAWCLRLSSFSSVSSLLLCAPLGACLLPLHLCLLRHCTLGSSSSTSLL